MSTRKRERDIDPRVWEAILDLVQDPKKYGASEIRRQLQARENIRGESEFGDWVPGLRTMQRVVRDIRGRLTPLDAPFEWHEMEQYGLPWEAGPYLLEMWITSKEPPLPTDRFPPESAPTARAARWVWRTHLAVPDLDVLYIRHFAGRFAQRELAHEVLGVPFYVADLEAHLVYRPWEGWPEDLSMYNRYQRAVQEGRIPPLEDAIKWIDQVLGGLKQLPSQLGRNIPHIGGRPMTGAELAPLLPLQAGLMELAKRKQQGQEALE
jgi:hypothetical protein